MCYFIFVVIIHLMCVENAASMCTTSYGGEPCPLVPAPPGQRPSCARPGETFCEKVEHYPMQHITYLIEKWGYDYSTLFNDETPDNFNTYFAQPDYNYGYKYPEPIHIPKPPHGSSLYHHPNPNNPNNKYIPPSVPGRTNYTDAFAGYPDRRQPIKYPGYNIASPPGNHIANHNRPRVHAHHGHFVPSTGPVGYYPGAYPNQNINQNFNPNLHPNLNQNFNQNQWWRSRNKRSPSIVTKNTTINTTHTSVRNKRQANLGGPQQLCPTRAQFIMPRAALNNKGNWMYVVNLQEQDNRYTQLVRSETCLSQECNGICAVPTGYTARCEQRYVQKRLVALESAGQNLYTDVFWFPSCCVCTFTNN